MKPILLAILAITTIGMSHLYASDSSFIGQCGKVEKIKDKLKRRGELIVTFSESYTFSRLRGNYRLSKNDPRLGYKETYSVAPNFLMDNGDIRDAKLLLYKNTITDLLKYAQVGDTFACVIFSFDLNLIRNGIEYTVGTGATAEKAAAAAEEALSGKLNP